MYDESCCKQKDTEKIVVYISSNDIKTIKITFPLPDQTLLDNLIKIEHSVELKNDIYQTASIKCEIECNKVCIKANIDALILNDSCYKYFS